MHAFFEQHGYLVLPQFASRQALAALRERALALVQSFDADANRAIFSARAQQREVDDYFLDSAHTVRCFFEEDAFDVHGGLRQDKTLSINKIGHALHDLDPVFDQFSHGPALADVARQVGLARAQIRQSMYIFKQPTIGGEVRWHQDASFFDTTPSTVTAFWFALEDAHLDNGCLWVQPGGQRGPLRERFVRSGRTARIEACDTTPWPDQHSARPLEVQAGTLVVLHGLLPHYSAANRSDHSRHAYTLHATDAGARYSIANWLQPPAGLPLRGFV